MILVSAEGRYSILGADLPSGDFAPIGVLLEDPETDRLQVRLRRDWDVIAPEDDLLPLLEDDLQAKADEMGAGRFLAWAEENLSGTIRITDRDRVLVDRFDRTLDRLYQRHIAATARPQTHIPRYSLRVAAGRFLDNEEVENRDFVEAPRDLARVTEDLFAAEIAGTSMEPVIPDGSLCLFRRFGAGSRVGKLVLVEELGRGGNDRYTVKRYQSEKTRRPDGSWEHGRILLEPLNPEHQAFRLDPDEEKYRILAEFVRVLY